MTATTVPRQQAAVDLVLRVASQLTEDQLVRLAGARASTDDARFSAALFRAHAVAPDAAGAADSRLDPLLHAGRARHTDWTESRARMSEVTAAHPGPWLWSWFGLAVAMLGGPALGVAAALRAVPWAAPTTAVTVGLAVVVVCYTLLGRHLTRRIAARTVLLGQAWLAVEGALLAAAAAHTVGAGGGLRREEYDLLTAPWAQEILPLPHIHEA